MKVALLGDIAFYGKYSLDNKNVYKYFEEVAEFLSKFDYVVGNLESPLCCESKPYGAKSAHIKSNIENVELLKYLNIDVVNLANNHIFDYGKKGYESTKRVLEDNDIQYFGIENKDVLLKYNKNKIILSGYCCYSTNAFGYQDNTSSMGINALNALEVEKGLLENHKNGLLNILSLHMGQEHVHYPNYDHVLMARAFAKRVPYVLYGHHPHVMQGIEQVDNSILAYSLGNFCFDDVYTKKSKEPLVKQSDDNKKSFILCLEIVDNKVVDSQTIPLFAGKEQLQVSKRHDIIEKLYEYSYFLSETKEIYNGRRSEHLSTYINSRKTMRNFKWYLKRLNIKSALMILNSKKNLKKYRENITQYINN